MKRSKILYLILVLTLAAFTVLYIDSLALIMLLCALIAPVFLLCGLHWLRLTANAELLSSGSSCRVGESIPVTVLVRSRCPLSFPRAEAELQIRHAFCRKPEVLSLKFPVQPHNGTRLTFYIHAQYCGVVEIRLTKVKVYDPFRLFCMRLRRETERSSLLVLPEPVMLPLVDEAAPVEHPDSSRFAQKPGDDPSEIFGIREYRPGDQVSRMHWKLSSRSEVMLVKEFSAPIQKNILIYVEVIPEKTVQPAEVLLRFCYSLALHVIQAGQICEIAWFDGKKGEVQFSEPHSEPELIRTFGQLYDCYGKMGPPEGVLPESFAGRSYSSVTMMTNRPQQALLAEAERSIVSNRFNLLPFCEELPQLRPERAVLVHIVPSAPELHQLFI